MCDDDDSNGSLILNISARVEFYADFVPGF